MKHTKNNKKFKKIIRQEINNGKKLVSKLNKTIKNKDSLQKCEQFCKKDYIVEMDKVYRSFNKKYNIPYKTPSLDDTKLTYNTCKKMYCNPQCEGFDFLGDLQQQKTFKNNISNGFLKKYSPNTINQFKKRGALSTCVDMPDYNVFHK